MCNGLVEKFNGTSKQMLKRMCSERHKDWNKYFNALLFAYREVPHDSLGFSPFELLYERSVRGPMVILKELWTKEIQDEETKSTYMYQYILDLKERLEETCNIANQQLEKARKHYTKKTRNRQMKERGKGSCSSSYLFEQTIDAMERSVYNNAENGADGLQS